jgi:hypothetical protein
MAGILRSPRGLSNPGRAGMLAPGMANPRMVNPGMVNPGMVNQ